VAESTLFTPWFEQHGGNGQLDVDIGPVRRLLLASYGGKTGTIGRGGKEGLGRPIVCFLLFAVRLLCVSQCPRGLIVLTAEEEKSVVIPCGRLSSSSLYQDDQPALYLLSFRSLFLSSALVENM
jgi:hypothetical protein